MPFARSNMVPRMRRSGRRGRFSEAAVYFILAGAALAEPESHVRMADDLYRRLRYEAVKGGCVDTRLPPHITIDREEYVNAAAMLDDHGAPQLVVYKGLLDFDGLLSSSA